MNDEIIIDYIWPEKICWYNSYIKSNKVSEDMITYLRNRYDDSLSDKETLYRIKHKIDVRPVCEKCGGVVKFTGYGFNRFCSRSCQINQEKIKQSIKNKYGVDNISQLDDVKKKVKETVINKYGVPNAFNIGKEKSIKYRKEHKDEVSKKRADTCIDKYGVPCIFNDKDIKNRIKETNLKKYGCEVAIKSEIVREHLSESIKNSLPKQYDTKRKNGTFNTSKDEDTSYALLLEKYPDVKRQYKSDVYPYLCDFYIPSLDLYIECNYHWTHGGHPYNPNNEDDIVKLNTWKTKNSKFYNIGINTWTVRDVDKFNIAKINNLNYKTFYTIKELQFWLKQSD